MVLALVSLSYGCGGGSSDYIFIESKTVYAGGDTDSTGKIYFTSQSEPLVIIEAKEDGTLPESSSLTLKERDLEASEVGDYGNVSTKAYTLTGTVEKGGVIRPLSETMKPITITIPNRFSSEYTEFWLGFKSTDDLVWQYQKIPDDGISVVASARMSLAPTEFVIKTYRLNYVFTIFAVKPEDLIKERVESFSLTAEPLKYEFVASDGVALFCDDLKISSLITANDAYVFNNPKVVHELTFISDSSQGSNFTIDGTRPNEQIYLSPESDSRYVHKLTIDSYGPENCEISGILATFSFVLNIKDKSLDVLPDNFKVTTTVTTHKNTLFTYEEAFMRRKNISAEPAYCDVAMIEPNPCENVATNTKIVFRSEKEILWEDAYASYIKLYDEDNAIASVTCSISADKKEITVVPLKGLRYETTYTVALRKGIPVNEPNWALGSATCEFVTIPASFTMASIEVTEGSLYKGAYKTNPSFVIDFVKPVANLVEAENAISVMSPEGPIHFTLVWGPENTDATLSFKNDLKSDTRYSITMNKTVKDIENVDIAQFGVLNFTTIPDVLAEIKTPADVTNAGIDTVIAIKLSPAIDWSDSCQSLISVTNEDNRAASFNCSYATSTGILTLTPREVLQYNMNYTVVLADGMMNHASNQRLGTTSLTFKTNYKVPGTGSEPEHVLAALTVPAEDYVDDSSVPPVITLGARFSVDFKNSPRDLHQAENAIKIYSNYAEATKLSTEWNEEKTKLTFTISQNMASETIRVAFIGDIYDSRNVLIDKFAEARFETTAFAGEGTAESPYLVSLPLQLDLVRKNLSAHYLQINDIDLTGYVSKITENYEANGFEPIGYLDVSVLMGGMADPASLLFTGVYDGGNYKIKGFWQNGNDSAVVGGLFGGIVGPDSAIKNVHLDNPEGVISGPIYVSSICCILSLGTISNCSNNIPLEISESMWSSALGINAIGGIVCMCEGSIDHCQNNGNITGSDNSMYIGGIAAGFGSLMGASLESLTVSNCVNTGNISASAEELGGIIGYCDYSNIFILNCRNTGNIVNSREDSYTFTSGIIARFGSYDKIDSCVNNGDVTSTGGMAAGIVACDSSNCLVSNCINTGKITVLECNEYSECAAGIFANPNYSDTVCSCVNTGDISGYIAAGLCGYLYYTELSNCYTEGSITALDVNDDEEEARTRAGVFAQYANGDAIVKDNFTTKKTLVNGSAITSDDLFGDEPSSSVSVLYSYLLNNGYEEEIKATEWSGDAPWKDSSKWILSSNKLPELILSSE